MSDDKFDKIVLKEGREKMTFWEFIKHMSYMSTETYELSKCDELPLSEREHLYLVSSTSSHLAKLLLEICKLNGGKEPW